MTEKSLPRLDWRVVFNRASPPGSRGWGRVRAAQLLEMSRAMQIAAWGQSLNALFIVYMMIGRAPAIHIALWLLSLAMVMHHIAGNRAKLRGRHIHSIPRRTLNRAAYHSVLFGVVWAFPARHFFEYANHGQQLGICMITAIMMAGAAFIFAPVARRSALCADHGRCRHPDADELGFVADRCDRADLHGGNAVDGDDERPRLHAAQVPRYRAR